MSYDNQYGALYPNNYLVTEIKYTMTADSKLTYDISSHDRTYDAEHYAVAVSTTGYEPGDFTIIFEETLNAGAPAYEGALQGEWFNREIDLSSYAGLDIYIAFRHYNCTNQAWVKLDNVSLTSSQLTTEHKSQKYLCSSMTLTKALSVSTKAVNTLLAQWFTFKHTMLQIHLLTKNLN